MISPASLDEICERYAMVSCVTVSKVGSEKAKLDYKGLSTDPVILSRLRHRGGYGEGVKQCLRAISKASCSAVSEVGLETAA